MKHYPPPLPPKNNTPNPIAGGKKPPSSASSFKLHKIPGDFVGRIRVSGGSATINGRLHGNIVALRKNAPVDPSSPRPFEVKAGERLVVDGDVDGTIEVENAHVHVKLGVFGHIDPALTGVIVQIGSKTSPSQPHQLALPGGFSSSDNLYEKDDCLERHFKPTNEGPVEIIDLLDLKSVQKDYGTHMMVYDRSFRKLLDKGSRSVKPKEREISRFKRDIAEAAEEDPAIAGFVSMNPDLKIDFDINRYMELAKRLNQNP